MRLTSCVGFICPSPVRIKARGRTRRKGSSAAFRIDAQGLDPLSQRIAERKNQRAKQLELKKSQLNVKQADARDALNERQRSLQSKNEVLLREAQAANETSRVERQEALSKFNAQRQLSREKAESRARARREARLQGKQLVAEQKVLIAARAQKQQEELKATNATRRVARAQRDANEASKKNIRRESWRSLYFTVGGSSKLIKTKPPINVADPFSERKYRLFPNLGRALGKIIRGELRVQSSSFTAALDPVKEIKCAGAPGTLSKPAPEKMQEFLQAKEPQTDTPPFGEMESQNQIDAVNQEWAERWSKR